MTISNINKVPQSHFLSFSSLRSAHHELINRSTPELNEGEFATEVQKFLTLAVATGVLLADDSERSISQSLIDYWSTVLVRAGKLRSAALLASFDPALAPELSDDLCPYRGLESFREQDRSLFFGREASITSMVSSLEMGRFLAVIGPSGCGKSSLLAAGLVPVLTDKHEGKMHGILVPGSHPLESLHRMVTGEQSNDKRVLDRFRSDPNYLIELLGGSKAIPTLLVVDQFEELFTLTAPEDQKAFTDNLLNMISFSPLKHTLVVAMREDFEPYLARDARLQRLFDTDAVRIRALGPKELRSVIEVPAEKVGLKFEIGIVEDLVKDILGEPAALPLLQFTLLKLWEKRTRNLVTWESYRKLGGPLKALQTSADELYNSLLPQEKFTAQRILLRLVRPTESLEVTSKRERLASLQTIESPERVLSVVQKFVRAGLLRLTKGDRPEDDQVEVAHEALIRNWPTLVALLDEERVRLRDRLRLSAAAELWNEHQNDANTSGDLGGLIGGKLLEQAENYQDLNQVERAFVQASRKAKDAAEKTKIRAARFKEFVRIAVVVVCVLLSFVLLHLYRRANFEANRADQEERKASARELAAVSDKNLSVDPNLSNFLAFFAALRTLTKDRAVEPEVVDVMNRALQVPNNFSASKGLQLGELTSPVTSVAFSSNRKYFVTGSADGSARIRMGNSGATAGTVLVTVNSPKNAAITEVAFTPDGLAFITSDNGGFVTLWSAETGDSIWSIHPTSKAVPSFSVSPDGRQLVTCAGDSTLLVWDLKSGLLVRSLSAPTGRFTTVLFNPSGQTLAAASVDGTTKIWNTGSGTVVASLPTNKGASSLAFSPDGDKIAIAGTDKTIQVWNLATVSLARTWAADSVLTSVAFSPDGKMVATGTSASGAQVWDPTSGRMMLSLTYGGMGGISSLAFDPSGKILIAASADRRVTQWQIVTPGPQSAEGYYYQSVAHGIENAPKALPQGERQQTNHIAALPYGDPNTAANSERALKIPPPILTGQGHVEDVQFFCGEAVATSGADGTVKVWDATTGILKWISATSPSEIIQFVSNRDCSVLATLDSDGTVSIENILKGDRNEFTNARGIATSIALSPGGNELAVGFIDGTVLTWKVDSHKLVQSLQAHAAAVTVAKFSANGEFLATGCNDGSASLWDLPSLQERHVFKSKGGAIGALIFSPDSTLLAVAVKTGGIQIWNVRSAEIVGQPIQSEGVKHLSLSSDNKLIAAAGADSLARIWAVGTSARPVYFFSHKVGVHGVSFSGDGSRIVSGDENGTVSIFSLEIRSLLEESRQRAHLWTLSAAACAEYFHIEGRCPVVPETIDDLFLSRNLVVKDNK